MSVLNNMTIGTTLLFGLLLAAEAHANSHLYQDIRQIELTAVAFASKRIGSDTEIKAHHLDRRLKLNRCTQALTAFQLGRPSNTSGRQTVGVRCDGDSPWKVYVSLSIEVFVTVPVARRYLPAGHLLAETDLKLERRASSRLGNLASHEISALIGKKLRRAVHAEQTIPSNTLVAQTLVKRGQHIDIIANLPGIQVRVAGIAHSDGSANQRIWVKNLSSGQKLQAKIISPSEVLATSL